MSHIFRDVAGPAVCPQGSVVCIGAFDGLHVGHRALVGRAVARARALAAPGWAVLLSPACAAFDKFKNFMERGKYFKELVMSLK